MTIAPDLLGMGAPLRLALRHVIIVSPPAVALDPDGIGMSAQPCGSRRCQDIEGRPHGLGHAGETVQGTDGSEHMGEGGALRPRAFSSLCSRQSARRVSSSCSSAPPATRRPRNSARNRSVEARIGQVQSQQILPVDAAADRLGRPPAARKGQRGTRTGRRRRLSQGGRAGTDRNCPGGRQLGRWLPLRSKLEPYHSRLGGAT